MVFLLFCFLVYFVAGETCSDMYLDYGMYVSFVDSTCNSKSDWKDTKCTDISCSDDILDCVKGCDNVGQCFQAACLDCGTYVQFIQDSEKIPTYVMYKIDRCVNYWNPDVEKENSLSFTSKNHLFSSKVGTNIQYVKVSISKDNGGIVDAKFDIYDDSVCTYLSTSTLEKGLNKLVLKDKCHKGPSTGEVVGILISVLLGCGCLICVFVCFVIALFTLSLLIAAAARGGKRDTYVNMTENKSELTYQ